MSVRRGVGGCGKMCRVNVGGVEKCGRGVESVKEDAGEVWKSAYGVSLGKCVGEWKSVGGAQ